MNKCLNIFVCKGSFLWTLELESYASIFFLSFFYSGLSGILSSIFFFHIASFTASICATCKGKKKCAFNKFFLHIDKSKVTVCIICKCYFALSFGVCIHEGLMLSQKKRFWPGPGVWLGSSKSTWFSIYFAFNGHLRFPNARFTKIWYWKNSRSNHRCHVCIIQLQCTFLTCLVSQLGICLLWL